MTIEQSSKDQGVAHELVRGIAPFLNGNIPFRIEAWDGSVSGNPAAPKLVVHSKDALRRLLWSPGELGLARAFVSGDLDVEGEFGATFKEVWRELAEVHAPHGIARIVNDARMIRAAAKLGLVRLPPRLPGAEAHVTGKLHSRARDQSVIARHYDLSNRFYALILDETMAYSCAYWKNSDPEYSLHDAQLDKLELICRKLALGPSKQLLDIGCGWGSLALHAATRYGTSVTAVTLSSAQAEYVRSRARELKVDDRVRVLHEDYRSIPPKQYDAVATIEMGEHVGRDNYPSFAASLAGYVKQDGRLLVQQMSRPHDSPGGGPFIETYIAPDMFMRPVGETVAIIEQTGLEVRDVQALREHYPRTIWAWYERLEQFRDVAEAEVGVEVVRVWLLYLAGIAIGFERNRAGVDQILAVKPYVGHEHEMLPIRDDWEVSPPLKARR